MPLSRYRSGDFVSPELQRTWQMARMYRLEPELRGRVVPEGDPLGGPDAALERERLLPECHRFMLTLPGEGQQHWNESSSAEPRYHSISGAGLQELREQAKRRLDKRPTLGGLFNSKRYRSQLARAQIFLPLYVEQAFERAGTKYGSVSVLVKELGSATWSGTASAAAKVLGAAARDASELRLPLIVDPR